MNVTDKFAGIEAAFWTCDDEPDEVCQDTPAGAIEEFWEMFEEDEHPPEVEVFAYRAADQDAYGDDAYEHFATVTLTRDEVIDYMREHAPEWFEGDEP